jgi:hypothetical protein
MFLLKSNTDGLVGLVFNSIEYIFEKMVTAMAFMLSGIQ